jgi:hypothetical protein
MYLVLRSKNKLRNKDRGFLLLTLINLAKNLVKILVLKNPPPIVEGAGK